MKELPHKITEVRGLGLMIAIELTQEAKPVVLKCLAKGLLINAVQDKTLRILPPLPVKKKEIDQFIKILDDVLSSL